MPDADELSLRVAERSNERALTDVTNRVRPSRVPRPPDTRITDVDETPTTERSPEDRPPSPERSVDVETTVRAWVAAFDDLAPFLAEYTTADERHRLATALHPTSSSSSPGLVLALGVLVGAVVAHLLAARRD